MDFRFKRKSILCYLHGKHNNGRIAGLFPDADDAGVGLALPFGGEGGVIACLDAGDLEALDLHNALLAGIPGNGGILHAVLALAEDPQVEPLAHIDGDVAGGLAAGGGLVQLPVVDMLGLGEIGRASCRERV